MREYSVNPVTVSFGGLVAMASAMGVGRFIYTPILPFMVVDIDLTKSQAGIIASANFLGYLMGALLAVLPIFGHRRRPWILGALMVSMITTGSVGLFDTVMPFAVLRFVSGIASAFVLIFTSALVLEWLVVTKRPGLSAVHFAGVGTGIALSAVVVWLVTNSGYDWREQWTAGAAMSGFALLAAFFTIPWEPPATTKNVERGRGEKPRGLPTLILSYGLFGFGYIVTGTFLISIVRETITEPSAEAVVWLFVGLAAIPSVIVWNRIGGRIGIANALALACFIEAIGVTVSVVGGGIGGAVIAAVLLGGTFMAITALGLTVARKYAVTGDMRRVTAAMTAAFGLGQMIGPSLAGVLFDWLGSFQVPSLLAAFALVVASFLAWTLRTGERASSDG